MLKSIIKFNIAWPVNLVSTVKYVRLSARSVASTTFALAHQNVWGVESSTDWRRSLVSLFHLQTSSRMYLIVISGNDLRRVPEHLFLISPFELNVTSPCQLDSYAYHSVCRRRHCWLPRDWGPMPHGQLFLHFIAPSKVTSWFVDGIVTTDHH